MQTNPSSASTEPASPPPLLENQAVNVSLLIKFFLFITLVLQFFPPQPRYDPFTDLFNRVYAIESRLSAMEGCVVKLEAGIDALTTTIGNMEATNNGVRNQFDVMKGLVDPGIASTLSDVSILINIYLYLYVPI